MKRAMFLLVISGSALFIQACSESDNLAETQMQTTQTQQTTEATTEVTSKYLEFERSYYEELETDLEYLRTKCTNPDTMEVLDVLMIDKSAANSEDPVFFSGKFQADNGYGNAVVNHFIGANGMGIIPEDNVDKYDYFYKIVHGRDDSALFIEDGVYSYLNTDDKTIVVMQIDLNDYIEQGYLYAQP